MDEYKRCNSCMAKHEILNIRFAKFRDIEKVKEIFLHYLPCLDSPSCDDDSTNTDVDSKDKD